MALAQPMLSKSCLPAVAELSSDFCGGGARKEMKSTSLAPRIQFYLRAVGESGPDRKPSLTGLPFGVRSLGKSGFVMPTSTR
jgi:hypothetical protein